MNSRINLTIGSVLLAATTLVGCGGSSGNNSSYTAPTAPSATITPTSSTPTPSTPTPEPTPSPNQTPAVADVIISINSMDPALAFSPNPAIVTVGQTVSWVNRDSVPHTATGSSFNTGSLEPGATSAPITMGTAGEFAYHCDIHPTMKGTLTVVASSGGY
jgi:plastocyanin